MTDSIGTRRALAPPDVRNLDRQLRSAARAVGRDVHKFLEVAQLAKARQVHKELGFRSWPAYVAEVIATELNGKLPPSERRELVNMLTTEGMSERAVAAAVGVSQKTVDRDLSHVDSPTFIEPGAAPSRVVTDRHVVGLDDKNYRVRSKRRAPSHKPHGGFTATDSKTLASSRLRGVDRAFVLAARHAVEWSERTDITVEEAQALTVSVKVTLTALGKLAERLAMVVHPAGKKRVARKSA